MVKVLRCVAAVILLLLGGCGGQNGQPVPQAPTPDRASRGEPPIACDRLAACDPTLGVCLRCNEGDDPTWVWSPAPGSPWALRMRPELLYDPSPDLFASVGPPFEADAPSCADFEFDDRGFPVRTVPGSQIEMSRDAFSWTYDARGRVVEERVDSRPFCPINDYGTEGPCGPPDGQWDRTTNYTWEDVAGGGSIVRWNGFARHFDARGRLVREVARDGAVTELDHRGGRLIAVRSPEGTQTFEYDAAGRLVGIRQLSASRGERLVRWERDSAGHAVRLLFDGAEVEAYANTYDGDLLRSVRSSSPTASPPVMDESREHDAHGLLIRIAFAEPDLPARATLIWTRDERGVPLTYGGGPPRDFRCLARLARHFVR